MISSLTYLEAACMVRDIQPEISISDICKDGVNLHYPQQLPLPIEHTADPTPTHSTSSQQKRLHFTHIYIPNL